MPPRLHDPNCHGRLNSVELDGGEATLLSCSSCDYYSCTDDSLIEYPKEIGGKDQLREDTTGGGRFKAYEDMSMDDLTYVWYPDIDSIPSPIDDMKYLTIDRPTSAVTQHVKSSSAVTQRNQSIRTAGSGNDTTVRANDISQRKTGKDLQRHSSHSASAAAAPVSKAAQRSLSCAQINEMLELVLCPSCQSPKTLLVEGISLGDELSIRYCKDCGSCFGADDSMDLEDLERLFNDQKIVFKSKAIVCQCGNDDVERFVVSGVNQVTGQATIECMDCHRPMALETSFHGDDEEFVEVEEEEEGWTSLNSYGYDKETKETKLDSGLGFDFESLRQTSVQDPSSFHCDHCNHSEDGLFEKQLDINGRVTTVKCQGCFGVQHIKPPMLCPVCRNSKDFESYYDSEGRLINAACRICLNSMDLKKKAQGGDDDDDVMSSVSGTRWTKRRPVRRRRVFSIDDVRVGDHVTMHKEYVIWHHAIVVDVRTRARKLTVVHYTGGLRRFQGHHTGVREEELELDFEKDQVYVYDYGEDCDGPEKVVARARSRLGEHRYNPFTRNCEHFAYWCKLGEGQSNQVKAACRRVWKACGSAVGAGVREGVVAVCRGLAEGLPAKQVFGVGLKGGLGRVQGVAGGAGLVAGLKAGAVVFDVFLNLALEVGLFAYCAHKSRQKYKSGEITKDEFYREVCQTGCECAGGFIGATGGGFLGQLAIPVPFLGSLVGCTLGTLIGRFLGSIVGKKIADHFFNLKVAETVQPEPIIVGSQLESHGSHMSRKLPCLRDSARNSDVLRSNFCQP